MDRIDLKILGSLQEDAMMPLVAVAEKAGLSSSPCWRRIQVLIEKKIIRRRVALLDPNRVNVPVTVFVSGRVKALWPSGSTAVRELPPPVNV